MDVEAIDALLERYLRLLHEYAVLRERLNGLQTGIYQDIARANFSAERGVRYGPDHYDERMRASRRVVVAVAAPRFTVVTVAREDPGSSSAGEAPGTEGGGPDGTPNDGEEEEEEERGERGGEREKDAGPAHGSGKEEKKKTPRRDGDPLGWFGLLAPTALRRAQSQAVEAVEQVIPGLASVGAEMALVEIEVRRARKRRAKAEAAAAAAAARMEQQQQQQQDPAQGREIAA